ncbi:MAG: hypothetical protein WBB01_12060, partial [Phormidesmis sp.]
STVSVTCTSVSLVVRLMDALRPEAGAGAVAGIEAETSEVREVGLETITILLTMDDEVEP